MSSFKNLLGADFLPASPSLSLTLLRIATGATLFFRHGWEKRPTHWFTFMTHFPSLFHLGAPLTFLIAFFSDFVCSILLVLGLGTRWAAAFCFCNIFVAWAFVHHFAFFGHGPATEHGELIVLYLGALLAIFLGGPGYLSIDGARR
jgi:putative oxidoreductase